MIKKKVEEGELIYVVSHLDADGLTAAAIIVKTLTRLNSTFQARIERWIDENSISDIKASKSSLVIFTDFGSGDLNLLNSRFPNRQVVILDHHQPVGLASSSFIQVNPHLHEIDGSRDISGAGVAYLVAKAIDEKNLDLACIAVVGALGDLQDKYSQRSLNGLNTTIVEDAVNAGTLKIETDLLFFGRETRPIHKAIACTTDPFIVDISGEEDKSLAFLVNLGITPKLGDKWRALRDLSEEEKKRLFNALTKHAISKGYSGDVTHKLRGKVYTLIREEPSTPLRDAREFSALLNGTGRMEKPSLGVAICMGERSVALEEAMEVMKEYRRTISRYLNWLMEPNTGRIEELNNIYVVHGKNVISERIIGALSSILSINLPKPEKPIIAYSTVETEDLTKFSARTVKSMVTKGLDLAEILRSAAESHSGKGGGHNIAAGAQIPHQEIDSFLKLVDELVENQLGATAVGS